MQIRSTKKIQSEVSLHDPIGVDREGNEIPSSCGMWYIIAFHMCSEFSLGLSIGDDFVY